MSSRRSRMNSAFLTGSFFASLQAASSDPPESAPLGLIASPAPTASGSPVTSATILAAPWLAVLGVVAALVARVRLEVEREPPPPPPPGAAGPQG